MNGVSLEGFARRAANPTGWVTVLLTASRLGRNSPVEIWKSDVSQSTSSACRDVGGPVHLLLQIASGHGTGDFLFPEPAIYLCGVRNEFK